MVRQLFEQIVQYFWDAALSGRIRHESQVTFIELAGGESMDRITGFIGKGCQAAMDRSVEGAMFGTEQKLPAANNLIVSVYLEHDRAVRYQQVTDTRDLARNLARAMTDYALKQRYLVVGNRVEVPGVSVRDLDESGKERVEVFWKRSDVALERPPAQLASSGKPVNEPSNQEVKRSDKVTAESSEDEARLSEPFQLWVRDGQNEPVLWSDLLTPFYFGRETKNPQVEFEFAPSDQISRDHFAILYLPGERFLLRNNGRNGTIVIRGNRAVRLYTPPSLRSKPGSAKIARLCDGDIIRLQAGPLDATRIIQMAFCHPGSSLKSIKWTDSLEELNCADAIEPVARRIRDGGPPEQYSLIGGEQYLGSSITQGIKLAYSEQDGGFAGGKALAVINNFGVLTLRWIRDDVPAWIGGIDVTPGTEYQLGPGDELRFGTDKGMVPATRVVFEWNEN